MIIKKKKIKPSIDRLHRLPKATTYKNVITVLNPELSGSSGMREGIDTHKFFCQLGIDLTIHRASSVVP